MGGIRHYPREVFDLNHDRMKKLAVFLSLAASMAAYAQAPQGATSVRPGMTDWVDSERTVPEHTQFVTYPTPSRGEATEGSCLVYLPDGYDASAPRRYPVIYYLHGGTGSQREVAWLIPRLHAAIESGEMDPVILVAPQALPIGWYVNANESDPKVVSGPICDVMIHDLIPYIDSTYSTIASPAGRGIEGFSMGGRGALALAFSYPELFGAVSSIAGAVVDWEEEPLQRALECTFGDINDPFSRIYFDAWHPKTAACRNARAIREGDMKVRMWVGDRDRLYDENGNHITARFDRLLNRLGIEHTLTIVPGADHNPSEIFDPAVNPYDFSFWRQAFSRGAAAALPADVAAFISANFPEQSVAEATVSPETNGDHWLVTLSDGTALKFNEHGNWIRVQTQGDASAVPDSMIKDEIRSYLSANAAGAKVVRIEKVPRVGYDVLLSDGRTLRFDTAGVPIA